MPQSARQLRTAFLLAMAVVLPAFAVHLLVSLDGIRQERQQQVASDLDGRLDRINGLLAKINQSLDNLGHIGSDCSADDLHQMRSVTFELPQVAEVGLATRDGHLICTSWGAIAEPIKVMPPPQDNPNLRHFGPVNVEFMGRNALVIAKTRPDGSEINMLLPLVVLNEILANKGHDSGYLALIHSDSRVPVALNGRYTRPLAAGRGEYDSRFQYQGRFDDGQSRFLLSRTLPVLPGLSLVYSLPCDRLYAGIYRQALARLAPYGIALLLSTLVFYLVLHWNRHTGQDLARAFRRGEFLPYYQPLLDLQQRQVKGVEVLLRWQKGAELVPPSVFIPEAERSGQIRPITLWLIEQVFKELAPALKNRERFAVHINISHQHLASNDFVQALMLYLAANPNHGRQLVLEITEHDMLEVEAPLIQAAINGLKSLGVRFAIDDFGTGYCGLSYLGSLPVDCLKIDRSFIASIGTDSLNTPVLDAIIDLAARLHLELLAEGVETHQQEQSLLGRGVHQFQGWLYARAEPIEAHLATLERLDLQLDGDKIVPLGRKAQ
ncbi:EAL domain-containing protein [Gallaecimonas sp. GXIMD4217]|uniref:EAL domain-containing protein n=1 Tax=Gallaecimonas sp. GXIMD4217 TaxID=3131927 RepID=UPI00311AE4A8